MVNNTAIVAHGASIEETAQIVHTIIKW